MQHKLTCNKPTCMNNKDDNSESLIQWETKNNLPSFPVIRQNQPPKYKKNE